MAFLLFPAAGAQALVLNGGLYSVTGTPGGLTSNALQGSIFFNTTDNVSAVSLDGAHYQFDPNRVFTGSAGILSRTDAANSTVITGTTNNWDSFPSFDGNADHFVTAFSGQFVPQVTGTYNFHWNNDDAGLMYIDLNGDGIFQASERVAGYGWNMNGNVALTGGQPYNVIYMAQEFGGGQSVWWAFTPPGGSEMVVNPGDTVNQAGMWQYGTYGAADMTGESVQVTASSEIRATASLASFGGLTLDAGTTLTTTGSPISFLSTSFGTGSQLIGNASGTELGAIDVSGNATIGGSGTGDRHQPHARRRRAHDLRGQRVGDRGLDQPRRRRS